MEIKNGFINKTTTLNNKSPNSDDYFELGMWSFLSHKIGEAYAIFKTCDQKNSAVLFNIALCLRRAGLNNESLNFLENALTELPTKVETSDIFASIPSELKAMDEESGGYLYPLTKEFVSLFPKQAKLQIIRTKADILFDLGLFEDLKKLQPLFSGRNYANISKIFKQLT